MPVQCGPESSQGLAQTRFFEGRDRCRRRSGLGLSQSAGAGQKIREARLERRRLETPESSEVSSQTVGQVSVSVSGDHQSLGILRKVRSRRLTSRRNEAWSTTGSNLKFSQRLRPEPFHRDDRRVRRGREGKGAGDVNTVEHEGRMGAPGLSLSRAVAFAWLPGRRSSQRMRAQASRHSIFARNASA